MHRPLSLIAFLSISLPLLASVAGCSGDHAGAVMPPVLVASGTKGPVEGGHPLQLSINEAGGNTAALPLLEPGSTETQFEFRPDDAGTFFLTDFKLMTPRCVARDVAVRLHVGFLDQRGQFKLLHRIEPFEVLRLRARQTIVLIVAAAAEKACGEMKATFTARYVGRRGQSTGSKPGQDDGSADGDSDDGRGDDGGVVVPPPAACDEPTDDDLPRGGLALVAQSNASAPCAETFSWRLKDHVAPSPANGCKAPVIEYATTDSPPMIKVQEARTGYKLNLAWVSLRDVQVREQVLAGLRRGETVKLAAATGKTGERQCRDGEAPLPVVGDDFDLVFFKGDPREACLAKGGLATQLKIEQPADALRVDYAYGDTQNFYWRMSVKMAAAGLDATSQYQGRFYHRRARSFVTGWTPMVAIGGKLSLNIDKPIELRALLAEQADLDLVIARRSGENAGNCEALWILPYGGIFTDRRVTTVFNDITHPERDRLSLTMDDLP